MLSNITLTAEKVETMDASILTDFDSNRRSRYYNHQ